MGLTNFINKIIYSGTSEKLDPYIFRRMLFTNVVYLVLPLVYIAFMLLDIGSYIQPISDLNFDQLAVPLMIAYCVLGIYLNKNGFSYIGRLAFLIVWPLLMHILPIILLNIPSDYYLAFPLGIVFHSVLIQLFMSYKKEPFSFYLLMGCSLLMVIFFKDFLIYYDVNPNRINNDIIATEYYPLVALLYWLLFNTMTFYVIKVMDGLIQKNEAQNKELSKMNAVIDNVNKSLEQQVEERTKELLEANKILSSYAFYNAHMIKGPFCRIKGLVMLRNKKAIEKKDFKEMLGLSINELDDAIAQMQDQLNKVDRVSK